MSSSTDFGNERVKRNLYSARSMSLRSPPEKSTTKSFDLNGHKNKNVGFYSLTQGLESINSSFSFWVNGWVQCSVNKILQCKSYLNYQFS